MAYGRIGSPMTLIADALLTLEKAYDAQIIDEDEYNQAKSWLYHDLEEENLYREMGLIK